MRLNSATGNLPKSINSWKVGLKVAKRMKEFSEKKKAELRLIAQATFEATLVAAEKYAAATERTKTPASS